MDYIRKKKIKKVVKPLIITGSIIAGTLVVLSFIKVKPIDKGKQIEVQTEGVGTQIEGDLKSCGALKFKLPSGWREIAVENKEGTHDIKEFIHSASNSNINVKEIDYEPSINTLLTEEGATAYTNKDGKKITSFESDSNNSSAIYYSVQTNAGTYYCVDKFLWDKDKIWLVNININSMYYERLADSMDYITDNLEVNSLNPIPDDVRLLFSDNVVVGVPFDWEISQTGFTGDNGSLSLEVLEEDTDLSKYDVSAFMKKFGMAKVASLDYNGKFVKVESDKTIYVFSDKGKTLFYEWSCDDDKLKELCINETAFF